MVLGRDRRHQRLAGSAGVSAAHRRLAAMRRAGLFVTQVFADLDEGHISIRIRGVSFARLSRTGFPGGGPCALAAAYCCLQVLHLHSERIHVRFHHT